MLVYTNLILFNDLLENIHSWWFNPIENSFSNHHNIYNLIY